MIFFHIYNYFYDNGRGRKNVPALSAACLFTTSVGLLPTMIILAIVKVISQSLELSIMMFVPLWLVFILILAFILFYKNKYKEIYREFRKTKWDTGGYKAIAFTFILFCNASLPLWAFMFRTTD